ncbi:aminopeptidase [Leptothrix ochracea]|uniref:aminopeptidase n=1 Tax=Leptothrix ochracea TaxID=735331 RepID=UPI0034E24E06
MKKSRSRCWRAVVWVSLSLGLLGGLMAGCSSTGYLLQSVRGHVGILQAARPVDDVLADPQSSSKLQERLRLTQQMRDFAVSNLALPDNASYRRYADLGRSAAVWNVVAAPELSLTLTSSCFPVVGCVGYRGFFQREQADAHAQTLRDQGLDVMVYGVPAYSTLGRLPGRYFADPLLNTFINDTPADLAKLIFHELAHQVAFAAGDTVFNESFATAVERLGVQRWLSTQEEASFRRDFERLEQQRAEFRALTMRFRTELEQVFQRSGSDVEKRQRKVQLYADMRAEYRRIKTERWGGYAGYDRWFERANNASLAVLAAYNTQVPAFESLFERCDRDFPRFYAEVRRLAALPKAERDAFLVR